MKMTAGHDKRNYITLRDDLTKAHRNRYIEAVLSSDAEAIEAILKETILEVNLVIDGEVVTGLDAVLEQVSGDNISAQVEGFWANAWLDGYKALQRLGKPIASS